MSQKAKNKIAIPDTASIRYCTPTRSAGKRNRDESRAYISPDENQVRQFAASGQGNGSGYIYRTIRFTERVNDGKISGSISHNLLEVLEPVTKFTAEGKVNQKLYKKLVNCKHKKTRTDMYGAGCQKDYETTCIKCGDLVV